METVDPGQEFLARLSALEVERARIEAAIAEEMLAFADLRRSTRSAATTMP